MTQPRLSALLIMADTFDGVRKTIRHLVNQTARESLELVLVTRNPEAVDREALEGLGAVRLVPVNSIPSNAAAWAEGFLHSSAPVIVLCEDHSFPDPNWAEVLIDEHEKGEWSAVAPLMRNANPATGICWANHLLCFIEYGLAERAGSVPAGPGHNTSYARRVFESRAPRLAEWLTSERVLHADLIAQGSRILLSARTGTHHVNISRAGSMLGHSFRGGLIFGEARAKDWARVRAFAQACACPLIPWVRLARILGMLNNPRLRREHGFWRALPWLLVGLHLHALGEAIGYTLGAGNAMEQYMAYESRRIDHVQPAEQAILLI